MPEEYLNASLLCSIGRYRKQLCRRAAANTTAFFGQRITPNARALPISVCGTRRNLSRLLRSRLHFPLAYTHRNAYEPKLWIALKENATQA